MILSDLVGLTGTGPVTLLNSAKCAVNETTKDGKAKYAVSGAITIIGMAEVDGAICVGVKAIVGILGLVAALGSFVDKVGSKAGDATAVHDGNVASSMHLSSGHACVLVSNDKAMPITACGGKITDAEAMSDKEELVANGLSSLNLNNN